MHNGRHHGNGQAQSGGNRQETCQEAEEQQDPLLQGQHDMSMIAVKDTDEDKDRYF